MVGTPYEWRRYKTKNEAGNNVPVDMIPQSFVDAATANTVYISDKRMDINDFSKKSSKEINAIVATKIMQWIPTRGNWWMPSGEFNCSPEKAEAWTFESEVGVLHEGKKYQSYSIFDPQRSIEDAFKVVNKMVEKGHSFRLERTQNGYFCTFNGSWGASDEVPAKAITYAAILTVLGSH